MEEDDRTEYRESLDEERTLLTMTAFANTRGGKIFVGVKDDGTVVGSNLGKHKLELFTRKAHDEIQPPISFDTRFETINGKEVLMIEVQEARRKPSFYRGVAFKRMNKTTLKITDPEEIRNLFAHKTLFFDDNVCENATMDDIDDASVEKFVKLALAAGKISVVSSNPDEVLKKLDLVEGKKLKNAALMLFGKGPGRFFKNFGVKCAVLSSNNEFTVMTDCDENIMHSIDKAMEFINSNIKKEIKISGLRREETPAIPLAVIREALVNAVAHRDYFFPSFIYVSIHPGKIEIKNPGRLEGISVAELSKPHISVIKNPLIANALFLSGYIERWGSGTLKMINLMRENSLKDPEFLSNSMFLVRLSETKQELNEKEEHILVALRKNEKITPSALARKYKTSITTAIKQFAHLTDLGFISKTGKGKTGYYQLTKSN